MIMEYLWRNNYLLEINGKIIRGQLDDDPFQINVVVMRF
jgi:hypothetical protein